MDAPGRHQSPPTARRGTGSARLALRGSDRSSLSSRPSEQQTERNFALSAVLVVGNTQDQSQYSAHAISPPESQSQWLFGAENQNHKEREARFATFSCEWPGKSDRG